MAKKSSAGRQGHAARRPQPSARGPREQHVTLVRAPGSGDVATPSAAGAPAARERPPTSGASTTPAAQERPSASAPRARASATPAASTPARLPAPKPGPAQAARVATPSGAAAATRPPAIATRPAPARAPQRGARPSQRATRPTNLLVTPEHYGYVKADLRLTAALAGVIFLVIIILHFYLPS